MSFSLALGVNVPDLTGIFEGYEVNEYEKYTSLKINVSRDNLEKVFMSLSEQVASPSFLILEHPTHRDKEEELRKSDSYPFHKDVHYMDDMDFDVFKSVWSKCSKHCLDDGSTTFGFGSHGGYDEIFVSKYKILYIYATEPKKYENVLHQFGISKVEHLKTVWDNFTEDNPGSISTIEIGGKRIFELVEELKQDGLYFHEHRKS